MAAGWRRGMVVGGGGEGALVLVDLVQPPAGRHKMDSRGTVPLCTVRQLTVPEHGRLDCEFASLGPRENGTPRVC